MAVHAGDEPVKPTRRALLLFCAVSLFAFGAQPVPDEAALTRFASPDPAGYFAAAERLIERVDTRDVGLEALALVVLLAAESDPALAAGACVALASASDDAATRSGLWSLAVQLDPARTADRRWLVSDSMGTPDLDIQASRVLGLIRQNNQDASAILRDRSEIRARIISEGVRLGHDAGMVAAVLIRWEKDTSDDPCRGRLTVRVRDGGTVRVAPCPSPSYHHGSRTDAEWAMMIGIEMSLLRATPDSWPAQGAVGLDAAVPVWTVDRVGRAFGVSADRPLRRAGRWVAR